MQAESLLAAKVREASRLGSEADALKKQLEDTPSPEVAAKVAALEAELVVAAAALVEAKEEATQALQAKQAAQTELAEAVAALEEAKERAAAAIQARELAEGERTAALAQAQMSVSFAMLFTCWLPFRRSEWDRSESDPSM